MTIDLLPIGSTVVINDEKELMIVGYLPDKISKDQKYDYVCCNPRRGIRTDRNKIELNKDYFYISKDDIDYVTYIGLQDELFETFKLSYKEVMDHIKECKENNKEFEYSDIKSLKDKVIKNMGDIDNE